MYREAGSIVDKTIEYKKMKKRKEEEMRKHNNEKV